VDELAPKVRVSLSDAVASLQRTADVLTRGPPVSISWLAPAHASPLGLGTSWVAFSTALSFAPEQLTVTGRPFESVHAPDASRLQRSTRVRFHSEVGSGRGLPRRPAFGSGRSPSAEPV
jgi:hypothetical protein